MNTKHLILDLALQCGKRAYVQVPAEASAEDVDTLIGTLAIFRNQRAGTPALGREREPAGS